MQFGFYSLRLALLYYSRYRSSVCSDRGSRSLALARVKLQGLQTPLLSRTPHLHLTFTVVKPYEPLDTTLHLFGHWHCACAAVPSIVVHYLMPG